MKPFFFFILSIWVNFSFASEKVDSFILKFYPNKVVVLSPANITKYLSLIIENKTLAKVVGRIEDNYGNIRDAISVGANGTLSRPLKMQKSDNLFFIPLSPAFQAVPLKIGSRPYEIPPETKD